MTSKILVVLVLSSLVASLCVVTADAGMPLYTLTDLGDLPGGEDRSLPAALNDAGQVVGVSWIEPGLGGGARHAFFWDPRLGMTDLGTLAGPLGESYAKDINNRGQAVGWSTCNPAQNVEGNPCGFLWDPKTSTMTWLGEIPEVAATRHGEAINDGGEVVGTVIGTPASATISRAFLLNTHTAEITNIGYPVGTHPNSAALGINSGGEIVGYEGQQAMYWAPLTLERIEIGIPRPGDERARANDINDRGEVVVTSSTPGRRSYLWTVKDGFLDLGSSNDGQGTSIDARAINNRGWVVGSIVDLGRAFLWTPEDGLVDLNDLIHPADPLSGTDLVLDGAMDINDRGQIVVEGISGISGNVRRAYLLTPHIFSDGFESGDSSAWSSSGPPFCDHDPCEVGAALDPQCDPCVTQICAVDDYCCTVMWDRTCVDQVASVCGQICHSCDHFFCETGSALDPQCHSCVEQICSVDDFCCTVLWDRDCVDAVPSVCGLTCD